MPARPSASRPARTEKASGTQAISRAFEILRVIAGQPQQGVRLADLTDVIDLPSATIHRILQALRREGVLDQHPLTRRYQIGSSYIAMLEMFSCNSFQGQTRQIMQEIASALRCSVYLSVNTGSQMLCIDRVLNNDAILVIPYDIGGGAALESERQALPCSR